MGVDLSTWRSRIGTFNSARFKNGRNKHLLNENSFAIHAVLLSLILIIEVLLVIGGVELNAGLLSVVANEKIQKQKQSTAHSISDIVVDCYGNSYKKVAITDNGFCGYYSLA